MISQPPRESPPNIVNLMAPARRRGPTALAASSTPSRQATKASARNWRWMAAAAQALGDHRPEPCDPDADRLLGHPDAALGQQLLDVPHAEREPQIEPNGVLDDGLREAKAVIGSRVHAARLPAGHGFSKLDLIKLYRAAETTLPFKASASILAGGSTLVVKAGGGEPVSASLPCSRLKTGTGRNIPASIAAGSDPAQEHQRIVVSSTVRYGTAFPP